MPRNDPKIEIARYEDAPWAPRLPGAKWAYRITTANGNSFACSTHKSRNEVAAEIQRFAKELGRMDGQRRPGWRSSPKQKEAARVA